jgi:hypothetical protein
LAGLLRVLPNQDDLPGIRAESAQGGVPSNGALKPFMAESFEAVDRRLRDGEARAVPRPQRAMFRDRLRFLFCGRLHEAPRIAASVMSGTRSAASATGSFGPELAS